jgi:hypothetical protein
MADDQHLRWRLVTRLLVLPLVSVLIALFRLVRFSTRKLRVAHQAIGLSQRPGRARTNDGVGLHNCPRGLIQLPGHGEDLGLMKQARAIEGVDVTTTPCGLLWS